MDGIYLVMGGLKYKKINGIQPDLILSHGFCIIYKYNNYNGITLRICLNNCKSPMAPPVVSLLSSI